MTEGIKVEEIIKAMETEEKNREIINKYKQGLGILENSPKIHIGVNELMCAAGEIVRIKNNDGGTKMTLNEYLDWLEKYAKK